MRYSTRWNRSRSTRPSRRESGSWWTTESTTCESAITSQWTRLTEDVQHLIPRRPPRCVQLDGGPARGRAHAFFAGGKKILVTSAGTDCSAKFWQFHSAKVLAKHGGPLKIGTLKGAVVEVEEAANQDEDYFGDLVPFGDPMWYQDWASPYYNDSHRAVRRAIREFTDEHLTPNAHEWDEAHAIPVEAYKRVADAGSSLLQPDPCSLTTY